MTNLQSPKRSNVLSSNGLAATSHPLASNEAISFPRAFHFNNVYQLESGISKRTEDDLKKKGHKTVRNNEYLGGGQAIQIDWQKGLLIGGSDPRKDGYALGL